MRPDTPPGGAPIDTPRPSLALKRQHPEHFVDLASGSNSEEEEKGDEEPDSESEEEAKRTHAANKRRRMKECIVIE
jgi:hypothetical protein